MNTTAKRPGAPPAKMSQRVRPLHELPLFAAEADVSAALIGPGQLNHWKALAPLLEGRGFPTIDGLMGGRYTPAIRAFFDREYGIRDQPAASGSDHRAVDGLERLGSYQGRARKRKLKPGKPAK